MGHEVEWERRKNTVLLVFSKNESVDVAHGKAIIITIVLLAPILNYIEQLTNS